MDDHIHAGKCHPKTFRVPDIANKVPEVGLVQTRNTHLMLLQFIAAQDDEFLGVKISKHDPREHLSERTGSPRDQHCALTPVERSVFRRFRRRCHGVNVRIKLRR